MTDFITKLEPEDEFNHLPDDSPNYNESMYFNLFDHSSRLGGWFRLGNRPNEGYAEMTCCLYLPDGRVGFMFNRPTISNNDEFNAGGMSFSIIEPFKHLRLKYTGEVLLLEKPKQMINPKEAFTLNSRVESTIDLDIYGISPMFGGEVIRKDGTPLDLDPEKSFSRAHYEQHTRGDGFIKLADEQWNIEGYGLRDKSWGPRYWQSLLWYRWLTININKDIGFMFSIVNRGEGKERRGGLVLENGQHKSIQDCSIETVYDKDRYQKTIVAKAITEEREYLVKGKVLSLIPLRNKRKLPQGEDLTTRITEAMTEYTFEGKTGYGMSEYLDQIIEGEPVGP